MGLFQVHARTCGRRNSLDISLRNMSPALCLLFVAWSLLAEPAVTGLRAQVHDMLVKMRYGGGGGLTRTELDEVMLALDKNGDGDIHFDEFAEW